MGMLLCIQNPSVKVCTYLYYRIFLSEYSMTVEVQISIFFMDLCRTGLNTN